MAKNSYTITLDLIDDAVEQLQRNCPENPFDPSLSFEQEIDLKHDTSSKVQMKNSKGKN